jgi:NitT/TauT family transport system substrate-binding protein
MGFTWSSGQYYSMFLLGRDKGIYSKHGMDVEMGEGQGSASTAQIIANKQADFAIAVDPGSVIRAVVSGARIKMVGQNVPVAPIAVLSKASNRISTPQELVGKRIGLPPGTTQSQLFPAFLRANNIEASSINIVNVQAAAMQAALAQGQLDGFVSFAHSQLPILSSMGVEGHAMLFSDFGLKFAPGEGIIVHEDTIRSNPDLVRRFVAATEETLRYAIDNVEEAADAGVKAVPDAIRKDVAVAQIQYEADLIKRDRVAGRPIVAMQTEDWRALIELLVQYAELQNPGPPTDYFTNDFVPTS